MLNAALAHTGLKDPADGQPLHYTPHDFRRIFITDAVMSGLPPHIAQVIAGHRDINTTIGYKAVYPEEAIQAHLAFLARRRALRPSEEYRVPTDEEWEEFLGHFELQKGRHRHLRTRFRHPLRSRAQLPTMQHALARPRPAAPASPRSATTSPPASPKPNAKAGSAKSKASKSASPAPRTSSPRSTAAPATTVDLGLPAAAHPRT